MPDWLVTKENHLLVRIFITCPYSYNFRNVVYSGFLEKLLQRNYVICICVPQTLRDDQYLSDLSDSYPEQLQTACFLPSAHWGTKILTTVLASWKYAIQNSITRSRKSEYLWHLSFYEWAKYNAGSLLPKNRRLYRICEKAALKIIARLEHKDPAFVDFSPDLLITTLAHKADEISYQLLARNLELKLATIIHSWDVITTKGFYPVVADVSFFWSKRNAREFADYVEQGFYGEPSAKVISGPVQFDKYKEAQNRRAAVANPDAKKTILYCTSVARLVPSEEALVKEIIDYAQQSGRWFVKVRIHPQAANMQFSELCDIDKVCRITRPEESVDALTDGVRFKRTAIEDIAGDVMQADVTVSCASSFALDSLALDCPTVWMNVSDETAAFYSYEHLNAAKCDLNIPVARTVTELFAVADDLIANRHPGIFLSAFERIYAPVGGAAQRIADGLLG